MTFEQESRARQLTAAKERMTKTERLLASVYAQSWNRLDIVDASRISEARGRIQSELDWLNVQLDVLNEGATT